MRKTIVGSDVGSQLEVFKQHDIEGLPHAEAVAIDFPGHTRIFIGGTGALDDDEQVIAPGELVKQTRAIFQNIEHILVHFGGDRHDLLRVNYYVEPVSDADYLEFTRFRNQWLPQETLPVSTMIPVETIGLDGMVIEIEADAIVPDDEWDVSSTTVRPG